MVEESVQNNLTHKKHYFRQGHPVDNETQQKKQCGYIQHTARVDLVEVTDGLYIK